MLILLAAVVAVLLQTHESSLPMPAGATDPWVGILVLISIPLLGWSVGRLTRAQLLAPFRTTAAATVETVVPQRIGPRAAQRAVLMTLAPVVVAFGIAILVCDWVFIAKSWVAPRIPFATHLVTLAPFWLGAMLGLVALSGAGSANPGGADRQKAIRAALRCDLRLLAAPLVPFLLFMTVLDAGWYLPRVQESLATNAFAAAAGLVALLVAVLVLAPFGVRLLWPSISLPQGPLRDRLEQIARDAGLGYRDIRVWQTGPRAVLNACISGVFPRFRYVIFTDALLAQLDPAEVEGVFAHELGHARHRHFTVYFAAVVAFFFAFQALARFLPNQPLAELGIVAILGYVYFGGWFGILSRHFELQADHYGATLLGSPAPLAGALERIGLLTRTLHRKRGWRHPSLPERIEALWLLHHDPGAVSRFSTKTRRFQGAIAACFVFGCTAYAYDLTRATTRPPFEQSRDVATFLLEEYRESALRPGRDHRREQVLLQRAKTLLARSEHELRTDPERSHERHETLLQLAAVHELLGNRTEAFLTRQRAQLLES
ncbi:MAG: M48 family metallopeptidase [Planctomycetota bacterium]